MAEAIELAREFVEAEFVAEGMIADLNVHWDVGEDGKPKPHAHVMLTMREVGPDGFGAKVRDWNRSELIEQWRERWAEHVNQRLAELDIDARIDHRSLAEQGIALEPQDKIGPAASRIGTRGLEAERIEEHRAIAQRNGTRIIANPALALDAITHQQATFTARDLAAFMSGFSLRGRNCRIPLNCCLGSSITRGPALTSSGWCTRLALSACWLEQCSGVSCPARLRERCQRAGVGPNAWRQGCWTRHQSLRLGYS